MCAPAPWRRGLVDAEAEAGRDLHPIVLVGEIKPAAAEIERQSFMRNRPGAPADAAARLEHAHGNVRLQMSRSRHPGGARSDHDNIDVLPGVSIPPSSWVPDVCHVPGVLREGATRFNASRFKSEGIRDGD